MAQENLEWITQKMCTDIGEYELIVEQQKTHWNCEQKRESWKWLVSYHGSVVSSGSVGDAETAKELAIANIPDQDDHS